LENASLAPTLHLRTLNHHVQNILPSSNLFQITREAAPSISGDSSWGLSAFAFQGTNAHIVVGRLNQTTEERDLCSKISYKRRYWICPEMHPLINIVSSASEAITFHTNMTRPRQQYLMDHVVAGRSILPGTAFMESSAAACRISLVNGEEHEHERVMVRSIVIQIPMELTMPSNDPLLLQVELTPGRGNLAVSSITSRGTRHHMACDCVSLRETKKPAVSQLHSVSSALVFLETSLTARSRHQGSFGEVAPSTSLERTNDGRVSPARLDAVLQLGSVPISAAETPVLRVPASIQGYLTGPRQSQGHPALHAACQGIPGPPPPAMALDFHLLAPCEAPSCRVHELVARPVRQAVSGDTGRVEEAKLSKAGAVTSLYGTTWEAFDAASQTRRIADYVSLRLEAACSVEMASAAVCMLQAGPKAVCLQLHGDLPALRSTVASGFPAASQLYGLLKAASQEDGGGSYSTQDDDAHHTGRSSKPQLLLGPGPGASSDAHGTATRGGSSYQPRLSWVEVQAMDPLGPFALHPQPRGSLGSLAPVRVATSHVGDDQALLAVRSVGVNFRDVLNVLGMYPGDPGPPGGDVAGVVLSTGTGVRHVAPGDAVYGLAPGCYGSHVITDARMISVMPSNLTFEAASSCPVIFITVDVAFRQAMSLRAGERVLMHAAAGGVGLAAIQVAQVLGAQVVATAGSPYKRGVVRCRGVKVALGSRDIQFASEAAQLGGVDVVLNSLTSPGFVSGSLACLRPGGRFVEISKRDIWSSTRVWQERPDVSFSLVAVDFLPPACVQPALRRLSSLLGSGLLAPLPMVKHSLISVVAAFRQMSQARHVGKIVVAVPCVHSSVVKGGGASVLVTGGLGSLGSLTASWLSQHAGVGVLVSGRTGRFRADGPLHALLLHGHREMVSCTTADASVAEEALLLSGACGQSRPVVGLVHAAGVLADATLRNQTVSGIRGAFGPKGPALLQLRGHGWLQMPRAFEVLFSSVASLLGSPGQANYSAANAFLDAEAFGSDCRGLSSVSIQWGAWSGAGMASQDRATLRTVERMGMSLVDPDQGIFALRSTLQNQLYGVIAAVPFDWDAVFTRLKGQAPSLFGGFSSGLVQQSKVSLLESVGGIASLPKLSLTSLEGKINDAAVAVLGLAVSANEPLIAAGLDSLGAVELRNTLEQVVGIRLPSTLVFDYPTVGAIAEFIARELAPEEATIAHRLRDECVLPSNLQSAVVTMENMTIRSSGDALLQLNMVDCSDQIPFCRWDVEAQEAISEGRVPVNFGVFLVVYLSLTLKRLEFQRKK
jgi:NADPH:quinone reductase-like Zn-dependent oxidoreductase/acyl carrier protein